MKHTLILIAGVLAATLITMGMFGEDNSRVNKEAEYNYMARVAEADAKVEIADIRSTARVAIFNNMAMVMPLMAGIIIIGILSVLYMSNRRSESETMVKLLMMQQMQATQQQRVMLAQSTHARHELVQHDDEPMIIVN